MVKSLLLIAALALVGAALFLSCQRSDSSNGSAPRSFVRTSGNRFVINGRPFRFVGANVSVMYRDEDRARMPETLRKASEAGIRVVRVWAFGEGGPGDIGPVSDFADWPRTHP